MAASGFQTLTLRFDPRGVATLAVDRALDDIVTDELLWAFAMLGADPRVRVVVLSPSAVRGPTSTPIPQAGLAQVMQAIDECPKPVIGRVDRQAHAAAIWLCSACDVVLNSAKAYEIEKVVAATLIKGWEPGEASFNQAA